MRITLDAHGVGRLGGGRTYMLPLLRTMAALFPKAEFDVWLEARQSELDEHANVIQHVLPIRNRFLARLALQTVMPVMSRQRKSAIAHFMKNLTLQGMAGESVVTIFDLHPLINPDIYPGSDVLYWRYVQPLALRRVRRIIAISRRTAQDLVRLYRIEPGKIDVIYPGIDPGFRPREAYETESVRARHGAGSRYVLHVGAISPKKNLEALIRAFALLKTRGYPGKLVLVGPVYEKLARIPLMRLATAVDVADDLIIAGSVTDSDLKDLMAGAELFAFPSMYEGFGLVVAEAMASGVPVVAARAGAVGEVVGSAAPIVDNGANPEELAHHMYDLIFSGALRAEVARSCLERAADFRLDSAARNTMAVYEKSVRASR